MKNKILLYIITLFFLLIPVVTFAGGGKDDITFTSDKFEDGYTYGNAKSCYIYYGDEGITTINDKKVCVNNSEINIHENSSDSFKCENSSMDMFSLKNVKGSDNKTYTAYGCRKPKDYSNVQAEAKELYIGESTTFESEGGSSKTKCSIVKGKSGTLSECKYTVNSSGTSIVRVTDSRNQKTTYYKITTKQSYTKISELDQNYTYNSISNCTSTTANPFEKVNFDGLTFCGRKILLRASTTNVTCGEGYESFDLVFSNSKNTYRGYGCRKIKNTESIVYTKKQIYVGDSEYLIDTDDWSHMECSFVSGNEYGSISNCLFEAKKVGTAKIKAFDTKSSKAEYYEYEILSVPTSVTSLDSSYLYTNVDQCTPTNAAYPYDKISFGGYDFCAAKLALGDMSATVTCKNSRYSVFETVFSVNGSSYKGYGCRLLKSSYEGTDNFDPEILPESCISLLGDPKTDNTPAYYISFAFRILKYVAIIVLIVLSIMDFVGAVASQDNDAIKKAVNKVTIRAVLCVIIFILPTIIDFVLQFINDSKIADCLSK